MKKISYILITIVILGLAGFGSFLAYKKFIRGPKDLCAKFPITQGEISCQEAQQIVLKAEESRDQEQQRKARLAEVSRVVDSLDGDLRADAKRVLNDPKKSVEEIRAEIEQLRSRPKPVSESKPAPESLTQVTTFANNTEDLGRLLDLYRDSGVFVINVEVRT